MQNRHCIFARNERKNIFGTDISKWALNALKRKIRVLNGSEKKILEKNGENIYTKQRRQHYNFRIRFWDGL